jgi:hypothetical protein
VLLRSWQRGSLMLSADALSKPSSNSEVPLLGRMRRYAQVLAMIPV